MLTVHDESEVSLSHRIPNRDPEQCALVDWQAQLRYEVEPFSWAREKYDARSLRWASLDRITAHAFGPESLLTDVECHSFRFVATSRLEKQFEELSRRWKFETRTQSSVTRITMHPAYLEIIGLGPDVIPLILRDLEKETNHWFTALRAIAKCSPVDPKDAGNMKKMAEAWIQWGKVNEYLD